MRYLLIISCLLFTLPSYALTVAAEQLGAYLPLLQGKKVGLIVNHTSLVKDAHLVDVLQAKGIEVKRIFAPEHGFRGDADAGASIADGIDLKSGLPIVSIYGASKKPAPHWLQDLDVLVFDIQDVGARFYTYISSMHYMMESAAEQGLEFIVLDRPNPNIAYVDGPVLEAPFRSFVGMHPIPLLHGMTVGELAQMIKGENWFAGSEKLQLKVIPVADYDASMSYALPVSPSPNLPNAQAIAWYPSLCLFEPTQVSIGRGSDWPFQVIGHDKVKLGNFSFTPKPNFGAAKPKLEGQHLYGLDLRTLTSQGLDLSLLWQTAKLFRDAKTELITSERFFDKLAGTDKVRLALNKGESLESVVASWQADLARFKLKRQPYLLYAREVHKATVEAVQSKN
ncbi:exo-beta-N-acetylmuramidase NamZ domain-containing protein [Pseudoalteromonas fenneropenaei]|uniref:Exo-beta-N-acetylmuramidase NamZ domain-containing protein n=1 Tax=Pseudoalteromonas fenneropenaei TaxID=1737459 RepID=A0ABV7CDV1_9GAMM